MPKKKTVVNTREETEIEVPAAEPAADAPPDDIFSFEGFDADDGKFRVHRMPTKPGEGNQYCQDYTRDELSYDAIRASWGGGKFRITAFDAQNRIAGSKQIFIAELPKTAMPAAIVAPLSPAGDANRDLLMQMIKSQGDMVTALLSRETAPAPAGPTAMELVTLIKALQPADSARTDPVALLLQGLELGKGLGGGGTDLMDLAKSGLETLGPLIAKQAAAPAAPPAAPVPRGTPRQLNGATAAVNGAAAPPAVPKEPTIEEQAKLDILKKLKWLQTTAAHLCQLAAKQKSAELYAEVFLDNLPPYITPQEVFERFSAADAIAQLAQVEPGVRAYAPWFEEFRAEVLSMMTAEDDDEPPQGDAAPNGEASGLEGGEFT